MHLPNILQFTLSLPQLLLHLLYHLLHLTYMLLTCLFLCLHIFAFLRKFLHIKRIGLLGISKGIPQVNHLSAYALDGAGEMGLKGQEEGLDGLEGGLLAAGEVAAIRGGAAGGVEVREILGWFVVWLVELV